MTKEEIFNVVRKSVLDVLPGLPIEIITMDNNLKDLGANSVDRAEIETKILEYLELKVPMIEMAELLVIQDLVDYLHKKTHQSQSA